MYKLFDARKWREHRLISFVQETGCLVWTGAVGTSGYAKTTWGRKEVYVHRATWEVENGPIPAGMCIDHLCKNRRCVNPKHLRVVTPRTNALENSDGLCLKNAKKLACSFCGGPYQTGPSGKRYCPRRQKDHARRYKGLVFTPECV